MARALKLVGGLAALVLLLLAGLYGYRMLMLWQGRSPEGFTLLTPMPHGESFEPRALPRGPVLESSARQGLDVNFGYRVGGISYSYALTLAFPPGSDQGEAILTARHASRTSTVRSAATRFWDAPRHAYAVALQGTFDIDPPVPSLCVKAVIGPSRTSADLSDASLCAAQRDGGGHCHPETLACGLLRSGT